MGKNKNTEYEKLTRDIYKELHDSEHINNIDIKHNVKIKGKSGCEHQIDVYWEFELAGEIYRVAIECKNYSKAVSIGKIRDFSSVLSDIGDIKGIFVTKVGYQSGAKKFADHCGISLKVLRYPNEEDWQGRVKTINIEMKAYYIDITKRDIILDMDWIINNTIFKDGDKIDLSGLNSEIYITSNNKTTTLYEIESKLPINFKEEQGLISRYDFEDSYIYNKNREKYKIKSIVYTYNILSYKEDIISDGEEVAKAILKDIKTGEIKFFRNK